MDRTLGSGSFGRVKLSKNNSQTTDNVHTKIKFLYIMCRNVNYIYYD